MIGRSSGRVLEQRNGSTTKQAAPRLELSPRANITQCSRPCGPVPGSRDRWPPRSLRIARIDFVGSIVFDHPFGARHGLTITVRQVVPAIGAGEGADSFGMK